MYAFTYSRILYSPVKSFFSDVSNAQLNTLSHFLCRMQIFKTFSFKIFQDGYLIGLYPDIEGPKVSRNDAVAKISRTIRNSEILYF